MKLHLITSSREYFDGVVSEAMGRRGFEASPFARKYLVDLLEAHLDVANLQLQETLAETLLRAIQAEKSVKREMLKRLADTSLYVSGFFGDSLKRKIVDVDYYAEIGGVAYANLASNADEDLQASIYVDFSRRFLDYVDLLTYISQSAAVQTNQDLLRLYERYVKTGSELAREQLVEKGIIATPELKKSSNQ